MVSMYAASAAPSVASLLLPGGPLPPVLAAAVLLVTGLDAGATAFARLYIVTPELSKAEELPADPMTRTCQGCLHDESGAIRKYTCMPLTQ